MANIPSACLRNRLLFDRETKQPRGTGLCDYEDPEVAKSAVRNLNGYEIGGRALHVEVASDGGGGGGGGSGGGGGPPPPVPDGPPMLPPPTRWGPSGPMTGPPLLGPPMPGPPMPGPPPLPAAPLGGRPMPVDPSQDAVLKTISSLTAQQLYDVVAALKVAPSPPQPRSNPCTCRP